MQLRGMQQPVLRSIQHGESPIVAVMPTGGGKSLLFMLPTWVSRGGLTIVVVPFISTASRHGRGRPVEPPDGNQPMTASESG
jgi:superfamily II DNA helicase RecQ